VSRRGGRSLSFGRKELLDLAIAWLALGVAFAIFLNPSIVQRVIRSGGVTVGEVLRAFALAMLTVGVGFLLHELGHKVVAVYYDQVAEFRADYGMLALAILAAMAGFLFAAPGAVHHRGRITPRQNGLISLAGPAVNVGLAVLFLGLAIVGSGFLAEVGSLGMIVNVFLAGFNMIPFGPLDGRKVLAWNPLVFGVAFLVTVGPGLALLLGLFP
jgi:Zn-dependent protease